MERPPVCRPASKHNTCPCPDQACVRIGRTPDLRGQGRRGRRDGAAWGRRDPPPSPIGCAPGDAHPRNRSSRLGV